MSQPKKMIVLMSSNKELFEVEEAVAFQSLFIKTMIEEDGYGNTTIVLRNVKSNILAKVLEYCKKHARASTTPEYELKDFDSKFFVEVDLKTLIGVMEAANYLDIDNLIDLACKTVAGMMEGKSPEEMRKTFGIKNNLTPEAEKAIRKENAWAFV